MPRPTFPFSWRDDPLKFRFVGRDGSMGYRTGQVYRLNVMWHNRGQWINGLTINRTGIWGLLHGKGYCPYKNEDAFWQNWEVA